MWDKASSLEKKKDGYCSGCITEQINYKTQQTQHILQLKILSLLRLG